jgi:hypothetical protein
MVEGMLGVWHYDELNNGGIAQLLDPDTTRIAGPSPHTSWVCYTRVPCKKDRHEIKQAIGKLMETFPENSTSIPFSMPTDSEPFGGGLPHPEDIDSSLEGSSEQHEIQEGNPPKEETVNVVKKPTKGRQVKRKPVATAIANDAGSTISKPGMFLVLMFLSCW